MSEYYFGASHPGMVRRNNEDRFFVQPVMGNHYLAACVIDGVGGYEGGEVAAQIAHDVLLQYLKVPSGAPATMMLEAMAAANDRIVAERQANPKLADMACVVTLSLVDESTNTLHFIHVGDTRLYLYRDGSLVKLTRDQSFVGFLEDNGRLSETEAMNHLKRNEIDKALGFDSLVRHTTDFFDQGNAPFLPGDLVLLCSDGLTDLVPAEAIRTALDQPVSLAQRTRTLIDMANQAGGRDNITVVLVQHSRQPEKTKAVKPKKKPGRKPKATMAAPLAPPAPQPATEKGMALQPAKKNRWLPFLILAIAIGITAGVLWWGTRTNKDNPMAATNAGGSIKLNQLLAYATDSLTFGPELSNQEILMNDSLRIIQDSLRIKGNGLHLKADTSYFGAGILLANSNRYLLLQDMVLEDFQVAILAKGQTLELRNVQFLNCVVPVQYGYSVPVNSPVNLLIKDSIFTLADTSVRK